MKKVIVCLLVVLMLVTALVACTPDNPEIDSATLESAYQMVKSMYRTSPKITAKPYQVVSQIIVGEVVVPIEWSVQLGDGAPANGASIAADKVDGMTVVNVMSKTAVTIPYTLTATMTDKDNKSKSVGFAHEVPIYIWAEYEPITAPQEGTYKMALYQAKLGGKLMLNKGTINSSNYFDMTEDFTKAVDVTLAKVENGYTLKIGDKFIEIQDKAEATAAKASYRPQLVDASTAPWTWNDKLDVFTFDVTTTYNNKESTETLYLGTYNEFNTISCSAISYLTAANAEVSQFPARLIERVVPDFDDAGKLAFEARKIIIPTDKIEKDGASITLPTTGVVFTQVKIAWTSSNEEVATIKDGIVTFTLPATECNVTLTAKLTVGAVELPKEIIITVAAAPAGTFGIEGIATATVGTYKLGMFHNRENISYFATGAMNGEYLATAKETNKAAKLEVVAIEGGYQLKLGGKFIEAYNKTESTSIRARLVETSTQVWTWNDTYKIFVTSISIKGAAAEDVCLGTYNQFNTIGASKVSGLNADNVLTTQHNAKVGNIVEAAHIVTPIATASKGEYDLAMYHNAEKVMYYATGAMSGEYLATTKDAAESAVLTVLEVKDVDNKVVAGQYRLKLGDKFIEAYNKPESTSIRARLVETSTQVWTWNDTYKIFVTSISIKGAAAEDVCLGTYNQFNTIGASKVSGLNAGNVLTTQHNAKASVVTLGSIEDTALTSAVAGTYKMTMVQAELGKTLYLTGKMSGEYLATSEDYAEAVDVQLVAVTGGYNIKVGDKYIEAYRKSGTSVRARFSDVATVWVWDDTFKIFKAEIIADESSNPAVIVCLGTFSKNATIGVSDITRLTAANVNKTQFIAQLTTRTIIAL